MIEIDATVKAGVLCACRISGHSGAGKRGSDVVCAAVSVLARSYVRTAQARHGVKVKSTARQRGELEFEITLPDGSADTGDTLLYMRAISDLTLEGFRSVAAESAEFCTIRLT